MNHDFIRALLREIDAAQGALVAFPKTTIRAVLMDSLTERVAEGGMDAKKLMLVKMLTMESACITIAEILKTMSDDEKVWSLPPDDALRIAEQSVRNMAAISEISYKELAGRA